MRYILSIIMAVFPSLAGDIPGDRIPSLSPGIELLHSVATPAQVKNNTVYIEQVSVEDYYKYKEDKKVEDVLATYYEDWRR